VSEGVYLTAITWPDSIHSIYVSLLLGGGYGFLTGEHGLAVDNLVQVCPVTLLGLASHQLVGYCGHSSRGDPDC